MKIGITMFLLWLAVSGGFIYTAINGIVMCFKASVILGVISVFVQGAGTFESIVYWVDGYDIAAHLAQALGLN